MMVMESETIMSRDNTLTDSEDLYQIALLIDQLKHDETQLRVNAARQLVPIARALGPERTRNELIPFLNDSVDDEDEVIAVIAEKLGELSSCVGGNEYAYIILSPLEFLICGEDSVVREKAVVSIETVVSKLTEDQCTKMFIPFLNRLAGKDWFTSRAAAASLVHLTFTKVSDKMKLDLASLYLRLCSDETPTVRRTAAQNLVQFLKVAQNCDQSAVVASLLEAFQAFSRDEQDSIRIQVIPICKALSQISTPDMRISQVLSVILAVSSDRSWRLRWALANRIHEIIEVFSENKSSAVAATASATSLASHVNTITSSITSLSSIFDTLLNDSEAEVRAAATTHLAAVSKCLMKATIVERLLPTAQRLASDSSEFVRASFALEICMLSPSLGRDDTIQLLLPILLNLLRDEVSEVRLNVISGLDAVNKVIGIELLSQALLPSIAELAQDVKWRVRLAVIEHLPMLARHLGKDFFLVDGESSSPGNILTNTSILGGGTSLMQLSVNWLSDEVFQIRKAAAENLFRLAQQFGLAWTTSQILPTIQHLKAQSKFTQRLTALHTIQVLFGLNRERSTSTQSDNDGEVLVMYQALLRVVFDLAVDNVPNIRLNVAKTLLMAANEPRLSVEICDSCIAGCSGASSNVFSETFTILDKLMEDQDRDVKFYAKKAMEEFDRLA
mmetsp:Transcript_31978/g.46064  ORF Transcript_31978/g.46064 Transcript_31978/m.46064 type:complete len:674 (-) Transcript_31978:2077-4098(-)